MPLPLEVQASMTKFHLRTVDLDKHFETCMEFRRDSYFTSFGTHSGFEPEMRNYRERMENRIYLLPEGNCHLWHDHRIIGQCEMKLIEASDVGYISLFYLIPEYRHQGIGRLLHEHAIKVFTELGKRSLQLSVSMSNFQALTFYKKHGWHNSGLHPSKKNRFLMAYPLQTKR